MEGTALIIDYSVYERQKIRHIIEKNGSLDIAEVGDISQINNIDLNSKEIKLIIMDLAFPSESDGFRLLRKLRSAENSDVPIIILTQSDRQELKAEASKYMVNDYIIKPYPLKRLEKSIKSFLHSEMKQQYDTSAITDINMSFDSYVDREIKYSKRTKAPLSLILITMLQIKTDPDAARVTDSGFIASVFSIAAKKAREALRATDTIVLNQDRDIIIVLPCTDETGARSVCEKIKSGVEPEFARLNTESNKTVYPVYVTFPKDGNDFQSLMRTAFKKISDKEMLEKIVSIPTDTRKYADKSYNLHRKWF